MCGGLKELGVSKMKYCVIVDGYKWSKYYSEMANQLGYRCIYVQSTPGKLPRLIKSSTYNPQDFVATFIYDGDFEKLVAQLTAISPIEAVIPGLEAGVFLADQLSMRLGLKNNNGNAKSLARTNKFHMAEALKGTGIKTASYFKTKDSKALIEWVRTNTKFPVVLKPVASAGTDGVSICYNEEDINKAFQEIMTAKANLHGKTNNEVLVQAFLEGTEYIVNTASCKGKHYVSDLWECKKRIVNGKPVYDRELLIPSEGKVQAEIIQYVFQVLDRLDVQYGAAHTEIMLTTAGPVLIETGARVGGNVLTDIHSECLGHNQAQLSLYSYLREDLYVSLTEKPYQIKKHLLHVLISTELGGAIQEIPLSATVQTLTSHKRLILSVKVGDTLVPTYDLLSKPGDVWLVHADSSLIEQDYNTLKTLISQGFTVPNKQKEKPKDRLDFNTVAKYSSFAMVSGLGLLLAYRMLTAKASVAVTHTVNSSSAKSNMFN